MLSLYSIILIFQCSPLSSGINYKIFHNGLGQAWAIYEFAVDSPSLISQLKIYMTCKFLVGYVQTRLLDRDHYLAKAIGVGNAWLTVSVLKSLGQLLLTRPDPQILCCRHDFLHAILWPEVVLGSIIFWWEACACICPTLSVCTHSGSPYNVVHSSIEVVCFHTYIVTPLIQQLDKEQKELNRRLGTMRNLIGCLNRIHDRLSSTTVLD